MLATVCGPKSKTLKAAQAASPNSDLKPLDESEIDILAERFEIGGRVHFGHFLQFFREMSHPANNKNMSYKAVDGSVQTRSSRPKPSVGISPFRMSSEWAALKAEAVKEKESEMIRSRKERESICSEDKEKEMFQTEMNAIDDRLSILSADNKSGKAPNKGFGIGIADDGKTPPRQRAVDEQIQRNKDMFPENFAESKVMLPKSLKFDSKNPSAMSSPDSKVAFNLSPNSKLGPDYSQNNGSCQKSVRSVLGQYEEVMADNEQAMSRESDSKSSLKGGRNSTGSPGQQRLNDFSSEFDGKNNRKNGNRNRLGELDVQGMSESKDVRNNSGYKNLPENIPGNRKSWGQSLGMFSNKNPKNDDVEEDTLKRPQRALSPVGRGRGVTRLLSWGKKSTNDGSSPVAL